MVRAVKKLKNDCAAGSEDIPPEFLKCALPHVHLTEILFRKLHAPEEHEIFF